MITEEQYRKLKREWEEAKADADRSQGALEQLMGRLQEEYNCDNIKDARKLLDDLKSQRDKAGTKFEKALEEYQTKWKKRDD